MVNLETLQPANAQENKRDVQERRNKWKKRRKTRIKNEKHRPKKKSNYMMNSDKGKERQMERKTQIFYVIVKDMDKDVSSRERIREPGHRLLYSDWMIKA